MNNNNIEEIARFIKEKKWGRKILISSETQIESDLGISGMDAVDFMQEFSEAFRIDISEFDYKNYFYGEGGGRFINTNTELV